MSPSSVIRAILLQVPIFFLVLHSSSFAFSNQNASQQDKADQWLKERFSEQHQQLIPIVAVADMYFACNRARKTEQGSLPIKYLVERMDKNVLAQKLQLCLAEDALQSDTAINFGLLGCFHEQLAELPKDERQQKMKLVKQAIASLSRQQRKESLTQCVTDQAINYLR